MSSIYLPYNAMYRLPEPLYALLTIHQFPWRWRVFAVLFGTICAVYAIENIEKQTNFKGAAAPVSLLVTVFLILNMGQMYDRIKEPWQERPANNSYKYTGQIGWEEYLIFGTDKGELVYSELRYDEERLAVSEYQKDGNTVTAYVKNHSAEETALGVPLMCYDNYLACYDTGEQKATWPGVNNCVTASVPGGYEGTIRIVYHFRSIWKVAIGTSVVVLISMIGYGLFGQRKKKKA